MSLLLSRLCLGKASLVRRSCLLLLSNGFSSSFPEPPTFCILTAARCERGFEKLKIMKLYGSCFEFLDKKVDMKMARGVDGAVLATIGSCHGWIAHLKDGVVRLQDDLMKGGVRLGDDLIQVGSDTDVKRISLSPLVTLPHCQTQIVTNVAMSSYSPEDEDCVVALKFLGPQLSFCRPAAQSNSSEWVNIGIENPCFYSSTVMFSKKDDMFRIPGSGGHIIGSWDLGEHKRTPKLQRLQFRNLPHLIENKRELLHSCLTTEHLVDSRTTGETFLVKWYRRKPTNEFPELITEAIMVFKLDETNAVYTEDIGDLCIFLTKSEPFCVPASSFPGLLPNYVIIYDFDQIAYVELADSSIIRTFTPPYHILPQNIVN